MKKVVIAQPPNPDDLAYKGNHLAFNRAMFQWAADTKGKLETASRVNHSPVTPAFVVTSGYAINTTIASTSTGTDVANFLCTFLNALTSRGLVTPN